ncbi:MAG TPA: TadE/TadG family type IV pilus assembly protein [Caulobacteraceae bacterium]|jgi:Flp pilus assembly protein TadG|nr:TadE/TadG family type IV pilus assembly protein [Caulobacteraceae bacterium]
MVAPTRSWARDRSGATAVETAIVLPLAILFILGIFQLGWGLYCGYDVRHAIERAARIYISTPTATSDQLTTAVTNKLTAAHIEDVTLTASNQTTGGASLKQVAWVYHYTIQLPFISSFTLDFDSQIVVPIGAS